MKTTKVPLRTVTRLHPWTTLTLYNLRLVSAKQIRLATGLEQHLRLVGDRPKSEQVVLDQPDSGAKAEVIPIAHLDNKNSENAGATPSTEDAQLIISVPRATHDEPLLREGKESEDLIHYAINDEMARKLILAGITLDKEQKSLYGEDLSRVVEYNQALEVDVFEGLAQDVASAAARFSDELLTYVSSIIPIKNPETPTGLELLRQLRDWAYMDISEGKKAEDIQPELVSRLTLIQQAKWREKEIDDANAISILKDNPKTLILAFQKSVELAQRLATDFAYMLDEYSELYLHTPWIDGCWAGVLRTKVYFALNPDADF